MGFYERWIVPRLLELAMQNRLLDHYRHQTVASARGLVLEVGVGSGLNLPLYGRQSPASSLSIRRRNYSVSRAGERQMWSFRYRCSEPLRNTCRLLMRYSIRS